MVSSVRTIWITCRTPSVQFRTNRVATPITSSHRTDIQHLAQKPPKFLSSTENGVNVNLSLVRGSQSGGIAQTVGESLFSLLPSVMGFAPLIATTLTSGLLLVDYINNQTSGRLQRVAKKGANMTKTIAFKLAEHAAIATAFHYTAEMQPSL
jgi:hypothetical protein